MTEEEKRQMIKKKIEAFFNELNDENEVTVVSVNMEWLEHSVMGEHDKYFLQNCDVSIKL